MGECNYFGDDYKEKTMADYSDAYYEPRKTTGSPGRYHVAATTSSSKVEMDYTAKINVLRPDLTMGDLRAIVGNKTIPDDATVEFTYVAAEDSTVVEIRWSGNGTSQAQCR